MKFSDVPSIDNALWVKRAFKFLGQIPPLPSSTDFHPKDPQLSNNTRMYAYFEARSWVASNLMWLEESVQLLSDARLALSLAGESYGEGFPVPAEHISMPGAILLLKEPPPKYDKEIVERARFFRYHIDDAIIRTSASFYKGEGLLGSYYSVEFKNRGHLLSNLKKKWPGDPLLEKLQDIEQAGEFKEGQRYRNPRIHSLGTSFRALYGEASEILDVVVMSPGSVALKPRSTVTAEDLFALAKAFYRSGVEFARTVQGLIRAHPLSFTEKQPFMARRIQKPSLHKNVDENKMPVDFADTFSTADQRICCTALVHNAKGRTVRVRWYFNNRLQESHDTVIEDDKELKATVCVSVEPGEGFLSGPGRVEWWLDDEILWKVPFRVVKA